MEVAVRPAIHGTAASPVGNAEALALFQSGSCAVMPSCWARVRHGVMVECGDPGLTNKSALNVVRRV